MRYVYDGGTPVAIRYETWEKTVCSRCRMLKTYLHFPTLMCHTCLTVLANSQQQVPIATPPANPVPIGTVHRFNGLSAARTIIDEWNDYNNITALDDEVSEYEAEESIRESFKRVQDKASKPGEYVSCKTDAQRFCTHVACGYQPR